MTIQLGGLQSGLKISPISSGGQTVASLVFHVQPDGAIAGFPFATQPVVWALDSMGAKVTSFTGNVTMSIASGGVLEVTTFHTFKAGSALASSGPGDYVTISNSEDRICFWAATQTGTIQPDASGDGVTEYYPVPVNTADTAAQIAGHFSDAIGIYGFGLNLVGTSLTVTDPTCGPRVATGAFGACSSASVDTAGLGTLSGTITVAAVAGVATFTNLSIDIPDDFTLLASGASFTVESASFTVAPWTQSAADTLNLATLGTLVTYARSDTNASAASWTDIATADVYAQATAGNQPSVLSDNQNHRASLSFGANDFFTLAGYNRLSSLTAATGFFVFSHADVTGDGANYILWSPGGGQFQIHLSGSLVAATLYVYVDSSNFGAISYTSTATNLLSVVFDGSATGNANRLKVWLNGDQQTVTFTGIIPSAMSATTGVDIGRPFGVDAFYWGGNTNEITIFNTAFSDANRLAAQRTIGNRWGVIGAPVTTVDGTFSGDPYRILLPPVGIRNGAVMIMFHGAGQNEQEILTAPLTAPIVGRLIDMGYIVASGYGGGDNWGNQFAINAAVSLVGFVESNYSTTKTFLFGQSMGSLAAMTGIAQAVYADVIGSYEPISATNLATMYAGIFQSEINTAYNIPGGGNYATQTAGHDPNLQSLSVWSGKKFRFVVSDDDTVVPAADNGELIEPNIATVAAQSSLVKGVGEHGNPSCFRADDVIATLTSWN